MKKEENSEKEFLSELSPRLFSKKIVVDAEPPIGYFDSLSGKVMDMIAFEDEKNNGKQGKLIKFVNYRNLAIAAGLALIIALAPFLKSIISTADSTQSISEISISASTEIEDLDDYFEDFELYEAFAESEINISEHIPYHQDAIIDYLMYEDYNEDLLLENIQ